MPPEPRARPGPGPGQIVNGRRPTGACNPVAAVIHPLGILSGCLLRLRHLGGGKQRKRKGCSEYYNGAAPWIWHLRLSSLSMPRVALEPRSHLRNAKYISCCELSHYAIDRSIS